MRASRPDSLAGAAAVAAMLLLAGCAAGPAPGARTPTVAPAADTDAAVIARVTAALEADPYYYTEHSEVTMEGGAVVLTGEVQDNRAMFDAMAAAQSAAPGRKIINRLTIIKTSAH